MARSFFSVWMPRSTTAMALRSSGRFVRCTASFGQLPVQRGELVAQVCRDHEVPVVSSRAARLVARPTVSAFLFCSGLPGEDVHHHQAVLRLPPRVLAEVDEVGLQPVVRPLGGRLAQRARPKPCTCRPTSAFSASKAMACVTSRSRCLASRYSFRGSLTLKSSAKSLAPPFSFVAPKKGLFKVPGMPEA